MAARASWARGAAATAAADRRSWAESFGAGLVGWPQPTRDDERVRAEPQGDGQGGDDEEDHREQEGADVGPQPDGLAEGILGCPERRTENRSERAHPDDRADGAAAMVGFGQVGGRVSGLEVGRLAAAEQPHAGDEQGKHLELAADQRHQRTGGAEDVSELEARTPAPRRHAAGQTDARRGRAEGERGEGDAGQPVVLEDVGHQQPAHRDGRGHRGVARRLAGHEHAQRPSLEGGPLGRIDLRRCRRPSNPAHPANVGAEWSLWRGDLIGSLQHLVELRMILQLNRRGVVAKRRWRRLTPEVRREVIRLARGGATNRDIGPARPAMGSIQLILTPLGVCSTVSSGALRRVSGCHWMSASRSSSVSSTSEPAGHRRCIEAGAVDGLTGGEQPRRPGQLQGDGGPSGGGVGRESSSAGQAGRRRAGRRGRGQTARM